CDHLLDIRAAFCNMSTVVEGLRCCFGGMGMKPAIAYIRVSTAKQGRSGLGLEAQQAALARFAEAEGFDLQQTFTETESGKHDESHRPALAAALDLARRKRAPIIVAMLDRLSR